jgi:hypothetical protein
VNGAGIGDTVQLPDTGGTVAVAAAAASIFPMFRLELVHSGRVIASSDSESGAHELRINENVKIGKPGWICARVGGDVLHHHGGNHSEYLITPFDQARTALEHRLLEAHE